MRQFLTQSIVLTAVCAASFAQSTANTPVPSNTSSQVQGNPTTSPPVQEDHMASGVHLAPGSVIPVRLAKTIDAKKAKPGDEVDAKVTQDMKAQNGELVVAKDTEVVGHITEVQARSKEQKESKLGITFDHVVVKDVGDSSLPMSIQAIVGQTNASPENSSSANDNSGAAPGSGGMASGYPGGRSPGAAGAPAQQPNAPEAGQPSSNSQADASAHQPITGNTQGVVGIANLTLSADTAAQGSLLSSDRNNVKLDSGTLMLLRVNPDNK